MYFFLFSSRGQHLSDLWTFLSMFLALSPEAVNPPHRLCRRICLTLFLVTLLRREAAEGKITKREWVEPRAAEKQGWSFFTILAKLSRVYQFNCGNTTIISRRELQGGSLKAKLAPGLPEC